MKYYTGVGSRETPTMVRVQMRAIAMDFRKQKFILRSGGADGADEAFEDGAQKACEIYVPWPEFNDHPDRDPYIPLEDLNKKLVTKARGIAEVIHPRWSACSEAAQDLHTRNVFQVLGRDLQTPSSVLICWAKEDPNGSVKGGTRTAVELALSRGIPVINLYLP